MIAGGHQNTTMHLHHLSQRRRTHPKKRRRSTTNSSSAQWIASALLLIATTTNNRPSSSSLFTTAATSNFCGMNWKDASTMCAQRQPCPSGSDDDCTIPGLFCFANTECKTSGGAGLGNILHPMASLPRGDGKLTRFCQGGRWTFGTTPQCSLDGFCGDDSPCDEGMICHYSDCHLHDVLAKEQEMTAQEELNAKKAQMAELPPDDAIRSNACGQSWGDANSKCSKHCWGDESECPNGEGCFGGTSCYNDAGMVPSPAPTTDAPTTRAPTVRTDPINFRFCGKQWNKVNCHIDSHCPMGLECTNGEICFTVQSCNIVDLTRNPTTRPTLTPTLPLDHESYYNFCGKSYEHAARICSLNTRCTDDTSCPAGSFCFHGLPQECNAYYLRNLHLRPTQTPTLSPEESLPTGSPTPNPTRSPNTPGPTTRLDPRNMRFCGVAWDNIVCSRESHCPTSLECPPGQTCFTKWQCNAMDYTYEPTTAPTLSPIMGYGDPSYFKFCGKNYRDANNNCNLRSHCASDEECPMGETCFPNLPDHCNAYEMMFGKPTKSPTSEPTHPPPTQSPTHPPPTQRPTHPLPTQSPTHPPPSRSPTPAPTVSPTTHSPTRHNAYSNTRFCGFAWDDITCSIETHCPNGAGCKNGQICYATPDCNIIDLTQEPTTRPTSSPVDETHPHNFMFCGKTFFDAVQNCSLDRHCSSDYHCLAGEVCFANLPGYCNAYNMVEGQPFMRPSLSPTLRPTLSPTDPPTQWPTRGRTRRPTQMPTPLPTPLPTQAAVRTLRPTQRPTSEPTIATTEPPWLTPKWPNPTSRPTDAPISTPQDELIMDVDELPLWCGESHIDANRHCGSSFESFQCLDFVCPFEWKCFFVEQQFCKIEPGDELTILQTAQLVQSQQTEPPTPSPTTKIPTKMPTQMPLTTTSANLPTTSTPTKKPVTNEPTKKPTSKPVTKQPTLKPVTSAPTKRPTPRPVTSSPTKEETFQQVIDISPKVVSYDATQWPTPKPVTSAPTKRPTPKPVTKRPTKQPTPKPVTKRPTKQPTPKPVTRRPTKRPTPKPVTKRPTKQPTPKLADIITPLPTSYPSKLVLQTNKQTNDNSVQTKKQPNDEGDAKKPSPQSVAKENAKPEIDVEEKPAVVEVLDTITTISRSKHYCLAHLLNFDEECVDAMECSGGNGCPSGLFCMQHDCKNRPPSNGSLDLCPYRFVGKHTKDCKSYFECDVEGYVGPTFTCEEGFKFDKSSSRCMQDHLVDSQCYRKPESKVATDSSDQAFAVTESHTMTYQSYSETHESSIDTETDNASPSSISIPTMTPSPISLNRKSPAPISSLSPAPTSTTDDTFYGDSGLDSPTPPAYDAYDFAQYYTPYRTNGAVRGERCLGSMNTGWQKIFISVFCIFSYFAIY